MKAKRLIEAAELLVKEAKKINSEKYSFTDHIRDEFAELLSEFIEEIFILAKIRILEEKISASHKIDIDAINAAIKIIKDNSPQKYTLNFGGDKSRKMDPDQMIPKLEDMISGIAEHETKLEPIELMFRLEMVCDRQFTELMNCYQHNENVYNLIFELTRKKLDVIDDDQMLLLWSQLRGQFDKDRSRSGFIDYDHILPEDFFSNKLSISKKREYYAWFIIKYKPLTILEMINEGLSSYPVGLPGIAKILSINTQSSFMRVSRLELSVVRLSSKLVALYEKITRKDKGDLAKSVGVEPDSLIFSGRYYENFKKNLENNKVISREEVLISVMKRIFIYAEELTVSQSDVSLGLWQYKLGQEIIAPEQINDVLKKKELKLQKELSKFLIERNIVSFGRSFGRSIVDLYTNDHIGEDFVIETKVYKKGNIQKETVENNIVQLFSYMDQISQAKGILVIFNCTEDVIIVPRHWFNGRLWVMAINIGAAPSSRKNSLELKSSSDPEKPILYIEHGPKTFASKKSSRKDKKKHKKRKHLKKKK